MPRDLDHDLPKVASTPAMGFSFQVKLGDDSVLTMQAYAPSDVSLDDLNAQLDKLAKAGERQKARADIEACETEIESIERALTQYQIDLADCDARFVKEHEELLAAVKRAEARHTDAFNAEAERHFANNRQADFVPKGQVLQRLNGIAREAAEAKAAVEKAIAEKAAAHGNLLKNVEQYEKAKVRLQARIDRKRALIGG
jgi:hypothetical protein